MKEIRIKNYVRYLFGISIIVFFINKFFLRLWVLENDLSSFFQVIVYSLPNLIEAIIGPLVLTGILLQFRQVFIEKVGFVKDTFVYFVAVILSAVYVVTQELKFHNLGGNNVYDKNDLIASVLGLTMTLGILLIFGFRKNKNP